MPTTQATGALDAEAVTGPNSTMAATFAGRAALWAHDLERARMALDRMPAAERGWNLAVHSALQAGVSALAGHPRDAATAYEGVLSGRLAVGDPFTHALMTLDAMAVLPADLVPEGAVEQARSYVTDLGAHGLLARFSWWVRSADVAVRPWTVSHSVQAADGVEIRVRYGPARDGSRDVLVVLAHGFTGHSADPGLSRVADWMCATVGVVGLDFRGHGESQGESTVGDDEVLDVAAAVAWARTLGYRRVATLGFSMGGAVVARYAGLGGDTDAVVLVSSPSRWYYRGTPRARRAHWVIEAPLGRWLARVATRTRIRPDGWHPVPVEPRAAARAIGVPLLVVHGDVDPYFPTDHADDLAQAPGAQLWIEPGFGHAELAMTADLAQRMTAWLRDALAPSAP